MTLGNPLAERVWLSKATGLPWTSSRLPCFFPLGQRGGAGQLFFPSSHPFRKIQGSLPTKVPCRNEKHYTTRHHTFHGPAPATLALFILSVTGSKTGWMDGWMGGWLTGLDMGRVTRQQACILLFPTVGACWMAWLGSARLCCTMWAPKVKRHSSARSVQQSRW